MTTHHDGKQRPRGIGGTRGHPDRQNGRDRVWP